ncbi:non-ribosomal peptide synthetase/type I polyketide synthase [Pleionea sp. CnH1-48]|uniref:non-ribosomal peptide synthetase/type I polyketide synthase n=1 Tax=Pleionea sp. CnH1-48 TaxID=2954494 RepID=UPI002096FDE2|nr:non-ribosomal peptide synthetase/type I polyketide synthase [Pleionea sp. CnH1-48]MCO7224345.1 amino acid adenylation domain-containing protein [Pleionea sp. CnH1-48]
MTKTLNDALIESAKTDKGIHFYGIGEESFLSYADLLSGAKKYLCAFQQRGVKQGDEIVLQFDALSEFLQAYWACLLGGIIPIPLAYASLADNAHKIFSVWGILNSPWLASDDEALYDKLLAHADTFNGELDATELFYQKIRSQCFVPSRLMNEDVDSDLLLPKVSPEDIAFIQFSSGSTGTPKGVVLTHANLLVNIDDILVGTDQHQEDVFLSWKPKSHDFGMIAFHLAPIVAQVTQVHIPTKAYIWSPAIWFQAVDKFRATILGCPNFGYQHFLKLYKRRRKQEWNWDLSCIRMIINGAEPISAELSRQFADEMQQYQMSSDVFYCAYGLAEASLMVSLGKPGDGVREFFVDRERLNIGDKVVEVSEADENVLKLVDCGAILQSVQVRITDGEGNLLPEKVVGKVEIFGDNVSQGYYNNPQASKAAIDHEGWFNTGDLGYMCDGQLIFASRVKEMIIINGINYFPYDIERAILQSKGKQTLNQFIACSIPHPEQTCEQLAVFVYYKKDVDSFKATAEEIREIVLDSFGLNVDYVVPTTNIPKTTSGKVQRFRLRSDFLRGEFDEVLTQLGQSRVINQSLASKEVDEVRNQSKETSGSGSDRVQQKRKERQLKQRIRQLIMQEAKVDQLDDDVSFFDIGIPSIRLVNIQDQIEQEFDLALSSVAALDNASVNQLTSCILSALSAQDNDSIIGQEQEQEKETLTSEVEEDDSDGFAIIGMSCRFPGGASSPEAYWQLLCRGDDPVGPLPTERWQQDPQRDKPISCRDGGFLTNIEQFDPLFFGITPVEALAMDPQQRLLLEVCHEGFENAGFDVTQLKGSNTGVFVGISSSEYAEVGKDFGHDTGPYSSTGNMFNTASGRISYVFGLQGPSVALDSACSSSLVSLHHAIRELEAKVCDQVIVAAVNLILKPDGHICYSSLDALSPTGRCRSFDDSADGYIRSEGCGAVVLKRLADAERDGDNILAVIRGTAVNHNGHNGGLTVPSADAQEKVIKRALEIGNIQPDQVDFVEAHGSGTKLGDPQEAEGLNRVFGGRERPLYLGSVKSNLGHLESAAGMAGLIKTVLSLQHGMLPPNLHHHKPNQLLDWKTASLQVVDRLMPWPQHNRVRTASITSLGINGSNAHTVLQSYQPKNTQQNNDDTAKAPYLFSWSARSAEALHNNLSDCASAVMSSKVKDISLQSWCRASNFQRSGNAIRYACLAESYEQLAKKLTRYVTKNKGAVKTQKGNKGFQSHQVAFLYTGQGSCYLGMGSTLYKNSKAFRNAFDLCDKQFNKHLGASLTAYVLGAESSEDLSNTRVTQALIFSVGYALTQFWKSIGIVADCVIGHSIGEYAAAVEAGVLSLDDAISMVALRGQIMQKSSASGKMVGLLCGRDQAEAFCHGIEDVWVAAVNSAENVTISGAIDSVDKVIAKAKAARVFTESLTIQHPFHSPLMADSAEQLAAGLSHVNFSQPELSIFSSMNGELIEQSQEMAAGYWARHLCQPVLFADAFKNTVQAGAKIFIEIGGNATLTGLAAEMFDDKDAMFAPSLREGRDAWIQINESLIQCYKAGADIDWQAYHGINPVAVPSLPNTAFNKRRYWFELNSQKAQAADRTTNGALTNLVSTNESPSHPKSTIIMEHKPVESSNATFEFSSSPSTADQVIEVTENILAMIAEVSGIDETELTHDIHLLSLGLDSLMLVRLGRSLVSQYGVEISLNELLKSFHSPQLIAEHVVAQMPEEKKAQQQTIQPLENKTQDNATEAAVAQTDSAVVQNRDVTQSAPLPALGETTESDALYRLMQSQLTVMQQQIQLLGGQPLSQQKGTDALPSLSDSLVKGDVAASETKKTATPVAKPPQNIVWEEEELTFEQRTFIQGLAQDLNQKNIGSKNYNADYSGGLADWLIRAHFTPATKEMCHLVVAEESKGCRFKDIDGNEYLDTCMGFTVNMFGHSPDFVVDAVTKQLSKGMILGPQSDKVGEVAKMICELTGIERVAFTNSGTEAVMAALRVARSVTGRQKVVRFSTSYHGTFDGILARADEEGAAPLANGVVQSMVDDTLVLNYGSKKSLQQIEALGEDIAAVLVEPVQSRNLALQPVEYLKELRRLTEEKGIALIFDEIIFGFRSHPGGIQARWGIRADLVTYGKVVGGGLPIGVFGGKSKFMDAIDGGDWLSNHRKTELPETQTTFFAGTFCKHPLAMAAAHAVMTEIKRDKGAIQKRLESVTTAFVEQVNVFFAEQEVPFKLSSFSSVYRFDPLPSQDPEKFALESDLFFRLMLKKGVYVCYVWENRSGCFSSAHTPDDVQEIISAIKYAVWELRKGGFSFRALDLKRGKPDSKTLPEFDNKTLSSEERRMFVLSQMNNGDLAYRLCGALKFSGEFDIERAKDTLRQLTQHHRALRTAYRIEDGEVKRWVKAEVEPMVYVAELGQKTIQEAIAPDPKAFRLDQAPLWRIGFISCPEENHQAQHLMVLEFSHLISDGISISLFIQDFMTLYQGQTLEPVNKEYEEYVIRESSFVQSDKYQQQLNYWQQQLQPVAEPIRLPADFPRPEQVDFTGDVNHFVIDAETTLALKETAKQHQCTVFNVLFSSFFVLLNKLSQQNDIAVGVPFDSRGHDGFERTLGMFAQSLVIRHQLKGETSFSELVQQVAERCNDAYDNSQLPLDRLTDTLELERDASRNALFDVMFIYEVGDERSIKSDSLDVVTIPMDVKASAFDLTFEITQERGCLSCRMIYASSLFKSETIAQWQEYFRYILSQIIDNPHSKVKDIELLNQATRHRLLKDFNSTQRDFDLDQTLTQLVSKSAATYSKRNAIKTAQGNLRYAELERAANILARRLQEQGAKSGRYVGILLPREASLIVAMLAVMKTGAAYVPMDPAYPKARLSYMLEKSAADILISSDNLWEQLDFEGTIIDPQKVLAETTPGKKIKKLDASLSTEPAYTIFTSGSTGQPKGVVVGHRSLVNFVLGMDEALSFPTQITTLGLTSVSFDIFVLEVFLTLVKGGTLVLANEEQSYDPKALTSLIKAAKVSVVQMTPSRLKLLLTTTNAAAMFAGVKLMLVGGEAFPQQELNELQSIPDMKLFNVYGPTETTVWSSVKSLHETSKVTLGAPIANTRMYVLDDTLNLLPIGQKGDLYIAGEGLAHGYLDDEQKTSLAFISDPFVDGELMYRTGDLAAWSEQGELVYYGRGDNQIKLRGYRIELEELENALCACEEVKHAAVVKREQADGQAYLVAFCHVSSDTENKIGSDTTTDEDVSQLIQNQLKDTLPEYMVPSLIIPMQQLPMTPNGKVDRNQLPQDVASLMQERVVSTESEMSINDSLMSQLREIWSQLLDGRPLQENKSFFDLGGNSMNLVLMQNVLDKEYPGLIEVSDIFANPTLSKLHRLISTRLEQKAQETDFVEMVMPEEFFVDDNQVQDASSLQLNWDEKLEANIKSYAEKNGVTTYDVVLAMHGLLLHKVLQQDQITLYSASANGYCTIQLDFSQLTNTNDMVKQVYQLRSQAGTQTHYPTLDRQHDKGVLTLFVDKQESAIEHPGFDMVFNINETGTAERLDFDNSRLCEQKMTSLASGYINLVKAAVNEA